MRKLTEFAGALARSGGSALISALLLLGTPAQAAGLIGTTVSAQLLAPAFDLNVKNSFMLVTSGVEISAGDGSAVGGVAGEDGPLITGVLDNANLPEQVDFGEFTISLRILGGDAGPPVSTGFGAGAKWVFSDLDIPGFEIVGATLTPSNEGFMNFSSSWLSFDDTTDIVSLAIDTMEFVAGTNGNSAFGDLTITLSTRAIDGPPDPNVPEPATVALVALALLSMYIARRRRVPG